MSQHPDAAIVGGGIIGLATAMRMAEAGLHVHLFDKGPAGTEASTAGAGLLAAQAFTAPPAPGAADLNLQVAFFQASHQARELYPLFAAKIEELTGRIITCATDGMVVIAVDETTHCEIQSSVSWQQEQGLEAELLDAGQAQRWIPGLAPLSGAMFPKDGYVDNQALVPALAQAVRDAGVVMHADRPVTAITTEGDRVSGVRAGGEAVPAGHVVLAAGAWSDALLPAGEPSLGVHPVSGQILVLETENGPTLPVAGDDFYLVPRPGGRYLAGSTLESVGFERQVTAGGTAAIVAGIARYLPAVANWRFVQAWAGLRPRAADPYPVVGPSVSHRGLWIATGHFRNGLLWAPLTGEWITRGVLGEAYSPEAALLGPGRFAELP